jgi:hypothetical protein
MNGSFGMDAEAITLAAQPLNAIVIATKVLAIK